MKTFYKNKQNIIKWLDKHGITDYALIPDEKYTYVVNVNKRVDLQGKNLMFIPVKFGYINGDFSCAANQLRTLEFSPNLVNGDFFCSKNKLTSLKFSPEIVNGGYYCDRNNLNSLEFCTKHVYKNFDCSQNKLNSLEFCPDFVSGRFLCFANIELKEIQDITDFDEIYLEHKKDITIKLYNSMEKKLPPKNLKKTVKI